MFFHDSHQQIRTDRDPDLGFDCIGRGAVKDFDPKVAFDPFEKQFYLPTTTIDVGYGKSSDRKVVGEKDQAFVALGIEVSYPTQRFGILPLGVPSCEHNDLIASHPRVFVYR